MNFFLGLLLLVIKKNDELSEKNNKCIHNFAGVNIGKVRPAAHDG